MGTRANNAPRTPRPGAAPPRRHPSRAGARRAVTFIEVIFSVAALALMAATIMSALNFVHMRQRSEQRRLGAAEMANRLVLTFLDTNAHFDPEGKMPNPNLPIAYADDLYRWEMEISEIRIEESRAIREALDGASRSPVSRDRFKQLTLRVWLSEHSGGVRRFEQRHAGTPRATIVRVFDPLVGANRNPDAAQRLIEDPEMSVELFREVIGGG